MIRRNISMIGGNLPNTFRLKKETINVNPVGYSSWTIEVMLITGTAFY